MNHHRLAAVAATAAIVVCDPAIAGGLLAYEIGTADIGLAGAGQAARASDAATVFSNPAGMTRLEGQQTLVGTQLLYTNLKMSLDPATSAGLGTENGGRAGGKSGFFPGGGLFATYSVSPELKFGFAAAGNFGATLKYDDDWAGRYYGKQSTLIGASLLPSVAYKLNEQWSVGASLHAMYGYFKSVTAVNNVVPGAPDGSLKLRDTAWGWGANVGVLYEVDSDTRLGATYNSPVKLDFKSSAQFANVGPILAAVLDARGLTHASVDLGITVPQQLMLSGVHAIDRQWTVLGDVGWQDWSRFGRVDVGIDSSNPVGLTTKVPFKDTWHGAVGAQYRINEPWRLDFGVAYDSKFQSGEYVSPTLPANDAWRFGLGATKQVSKTFSWGIAGEYIRSGSLDVNKQGLPVAVGGRGVLVGTYKHVGTLISSAHLNWTY